MARELVTVARRRRKSSGSKGSAVRASCTTKPVDRRRNAAPAIAVAPEALTPGRSLREADDQRTECSGAQHGPERVQGLTALDGGVRRNQPRGE